MIACTAEVLANMALREGRGAAVGQVVMDEFHFYADPDRGWAWQVPLLELTRSQFILMSATWGTCAVSRPIWSAERAVDRGGSLQRPSSAP